MHGLASWVKAELERELIDAQSGARIWAERKRDTRHAGLSKGPTGYQSLATAPIVGLRAGHLEQVAVHLTRAMAKRAADDPAVRAYVDQRR